MAAAGAGGEIADEPMTQQSRCDLCGSGFVKRSGQRVHRLWLSVGSLRATSSALTKIAVPPSASCLGASNAELLHLAD